MSVVATTATSSTASLAASQLAQGLPTTAGAAQIDSTRYLTSKDYTTGVVEALANCTVGSSSTSMPAAAVDLVNMAAGKSTVSVAQSPVRPSDIFADVSQGSSNMCSSMAFVHGYALRYALQQGVAGGTASTALLPPQLSAVYAYYFQRIEECTTAGVCPCSTCSSNPACKNACDPPCVDCGAFLRAAVTVFEKGVCAATDWPYTSDLNATPSAAARAAATRYRLTAWHCIAPGPGLPQAIAAALTNRSPVAVFLNLSPPQVAWMQSQMDVQATIPPLMPTYGPATAPSVGHVVLVVGWDPASPHGAAFLLQNNFGASWGGHLGKFYIALADANATQMHTLVAIDGVA